MKRIEGKDVGYKCISCNDIGILSHKFPLCKKCIELWDILLSDYNQNQKLINRLINIFSFLKEKHPFPISTDHDKTVQLPKDHIELAIGSRNNRISNKTIHHLIVLTAFEVDENYKRVFGDYLCSHTASQKNIEFISSDHNLCKGCVQRYQKLKNRFSLVRILDEYEAFDVYYNRYWGLINILYQYYQTNR